MQTNNLNHVYRTKTIIRVNRNLASKKHNEQQQQIHTNIKKKQNINNTEKYTKQTAMKQIVYKQKRNKHMYSKSTVTDHQ